MAEKQLIQFDWAIKSLLRNKASFPILEGFLSELFGTDVTIESLLESESNKESSNDKSNRVDVLAQLSGGEKVIIEVQCIRQWDFLSRVIYGISKTIVENLREGEPYGNIPKVISVNILYFDLGEGKDYIYHGKFQVKGIHYEDSLELRTLEREYYQKLISDVKTIAGVFPEIYFLKVNAFDLTIKNSLDEWMYLLKKSMVKSSFKAKGIQKASEKLNRLKLSEEEKRRYEAFIDGNRNAESMIETSFVNGFSQGEVRGIAKGIARGKAEGKAEAKVEMILAMKQAGCSLEQIASVSGASKEEIQEL